jgi:hypothetical protein
MSSRLFLPGVAALSVLASAAHAVTEGYSCDGPTVYLGEKTTITSTAIQYNYNLDIWSIQHLLADKTTVFREAQYIIKEDSNSTRKQWVGTHRTNPDLVMLGEIQKEADKPVYFEWLWDKDKLIMNMGAFCTATYKRPDSKWPNWLFNHPPAVRVLRP